MQDGDELFQAIYKELRKLANVYLARDNQKTLQPTDLVHEVYVRLAISKNQREEGWSDRAYFFGAAVRAMRQTLVDLARKRNAIRHGAGLERLDGLVTIPDLRGQQGLSVSEILTLHSALERFEASYPQEAEIVQLRYFAGLTVSEIAELRGVNKRTVERDWTFAKAWMRRALTKSASVDTGDR